MAVAPGGLSALLSRYTGPGTTLSFAIMLDILLMVVIGGMGTMYGAVVGATLFLIAQNYLQPLMAAASAAMSGVPMLARLFHPDRWLLFLGLAFVLSVYFFPTGLIGKLRGTRAS
jgi:branched-chain amino acid transport system permease protein